MTNSSIEIASQGQFTRQIIPVLTKKKEISLTPVYR